MLHHTLHALLQRGLGGVPHVQCRGRVHPQICWAKLSALSEGAALATSELW
jgi:hypothetical protein